MIITARTKLAGMGYRSRAAVGLDVTRGDAPRGYDDRPRSPRITPGDWSDAIAIADVPADATEALLVIESGGGTLAVEQVTITDAGAAGTGDEAAARRWSTAASTTWSPSPASTEPCATSIPPTRPRR